MDRTTLFRIVRRYVNSQDPLDLFGHGCPPDEYEGEVNAILDYLMVRPSLPDEEEFLHLLSALFDCEPRKKYQGIACQMLTILRKKVNN